MHTVIPEASPKRPVNLSIDAELLKQGRALGLNLSSIAEQALAVAVRTRTEEVWLAENAGAIRAYNARVEACGVFSDGLRSF